MAQKLGLSLVLVVVAMVASRAGAAQTVAPQTITDQLQAKYKLTKIGVRPKGLSVEQAGTVLAIQKDGILAVPSRSAAICPAKYQDGELHPPAESCVNMLKWPGSSFKPGEKVYVTRIDVNTQNDKVSFRIVACDACNKTKPPTFMKSQVVFQFPQGTLLTGDASEIEKAIEQVLAVESAADNH